MRSYSLPAMLAAATLAVGCAGGGYGTVTATTYSPDLVYVSPGVSVIADYNEPVFYSDNYYWRYDNNGWYRSSYYDRGWTYARPPVAVMQIQSPYAYRHYRPNNQVVGRGYVRGGGYYRNDGYRGRVNRGTIRDHRR